MPAAERRTTPGDAIRALLALMHELGVSWPEVRDRAEGPGAELAAACAIFGTEGMPVTDLTLTQRNRLRTELEDRVAKKRDRAAKREANKAARGAEKVGAA